LGHVYVEAVVIGIKSSEKIKALADTGATYSMLPLDLVKRVQVIETPFTEEVKLADGSMRLLPVGLCYLEIANRKIVSKPLIGGDEPLVGVLDMEALGIKVDPTTGAIEFVRGYTVRI